VSEASRAAAPARVWLVLGEKRGDNGQVEMLAEALGWPCERKHIVMLPPWSVRKPRVRASLRRVDPARSDPLEPPWPDVVITIGRRPASVALWIRKQSGGRTRLVLVGKPSGKVSHFDLVVVSSEVQMPALENVLRIALPMMRASGSEVAFARERFSHSLGALPRPLTALLVGGPTNPFVYDDSVVERLVVLSRECVDEGGTPFITTSRRTPLEVVKSLEARLPKGAQLYSWIPEGTDNPYLGLLALADGFIVTGDSISMQMEVVGLGRPLEILELPTTWIGRLDQLRRKLVRRLFEPAGASTSSRCRAALGRALHRAHLLHQTRDFVHFHEWLFEHGFAAPAGQGMRAPQQTVPDDLAEVVRRVRALSAPG
jgi:mitochondrial fission protein ELM1